MRLLRREIGSSSQLWRISNRLVFVSQLRTCTRRISFLRHRDLWTHEQMAADTHRALAAGSEFGSNMRPLDPRPERATAGRRTLW